MRYVFSISFRSRFVRTPFPSLGLSAVLIASGCGHTTEHSRSKAAARKSAARSAADVPQRNATAASLEPKDDKLAIPRDEQSEWVPITGDEQIIADKIPLLTDGAAVQPAPTETEASTDLTPANAR